MNQTAHDTKQLWTQVQEDIQKELSGANFTTWFKDVSISNYVQGTIELSFPNQFVRDWVSSKYHALLMKTMRTYAPDMRALEYIINKERPEPKPIAQQQAAQQAPGVLPLQDLYISKEDNLNPRYVFDTFIVGSFNELAHAAAQQIVNNPGKTYNPLFIYGKTGCGKTHLIQAIGNTVKKNDPNRKIYYITSEKFGQELVNALQSNKINQFKEKYRKYDVFIVDDIQFLSGKEKMQEELFHLFNTLYDSNRQIVFSSDQHPNYIPKLEERLKSRFNAGMVVDIGLPDRDTRIAIIRSKTRLVGFSLSDEVVEHLAATIQGSIRELEGALNAIICQSQLKNKNLSLTEVRTLLKNTAKPKRMIPIPDVVRTIAEFYNIEDEAIYRKTRKKEIVKPRQLIMYILREDFSLPYPMIGQKLGGRDHTTVIHSYEKIKELLKTDIELEQEVNQIRALL